MDSAWGLAFTPFIFVNSVFLLCISKARFPKSPIQSRHVEPYVAGLDDVTKMYSWIKLANPDGCYKQFVSYRYQYKNINICSEE